MRLHHAGHQKTAGTVDDGLAGHRHVSHAVDSTRDPHNFVALHQHFTCKRHVAAGIKHIHIGKQDLVHGFAFRRYALKNPASHGYIRAVFPLVSSDRSAATQDCAPLACAAPWPVRLQVEKPGLRRR